MKLNAVPKWPALRRVFPLLAAAMICSVSFPDPTDALELKFDINTTSRSLQSAIRDASLLAGLDNDGAEIASDVIATAKADYSRIVGVLYDQGYFGPVVSIRLDGREASDISGISGGSNVQRAVISVQPGTAFKFGRAAISPYPPNTERPEDFAKGRRASLSAMRTAVQNGVSGWRDAGHAKAEVADQRITARHGDNALDVDITLAPGPKLRFGQLLVSGDTTLSAARVRQIAGLPTGAQFDPRDLQRVTTRLRRTGVFKAVSLREADAIGPADTLDVELQLQDAPLRRFGFGAELSSEEGIELSAFWLHRNLLGGGERLRFDAKISGIGGESGGEDFEVGLNFIRPGTPTFRTDLFVDAEISSFDEPNYKADRIKLAAGLIHYASDNRTYSYALGYEAAETEDAFGERGYRMFTLPLTHERDYRDHELNATSGYFANFELTPFLALSGTDDGARLFIDGRIYKALGADDRTVFALRGQLGSVIGPALARAPADYLFYSGGGGTVRGQEYQSLGVELPNGRISGGRSFVGLSAEMRVKTGDKLSLVGFWDAGFIGSQAVPDLNDGDWHSGAGVGLRYDTGVGPIRVDFAVPVSGPGSNSGFELYIGIGQAF